MRLSAALLGLLLLAACRAPESDLLRMELADGSRVSAGFAEGEEERVVLLLDPSDCFDCYNVVWEWAEWSRANPGRLVVLLSREPTELERRNFAARRFVPDGVLRSLDARALGTPSEFLVRRGEVLYESRGSVGALTRAVVESPGISFGALVNGISARPVAGLDQGGRMSRGTPQPSTEGETP